MRCKYINSYKDGVCSISMVVPRFVKYKASKKDSSVFSECVVDGCGGLIDEKTNLKLGAKFVCQRCGAVWSNSLTNSFAGPRDKRHCRVEYEVGSCSVTSEVEKCTVQPSELR